MRGLLILALLLPVVLHPQTASRKRVLFFSKASSWEQKIIHRDGDQLSYIEKEAEKLGQASGIEFTFSKDGRLITRENLARYDAFFFFTSGDLTHQDRNGRGDNYPLMTLEGKQALLDAIRDGKGFIGCNTANYTFPEILSPGEKNDTEHAWRYTRMIGAGYMGHNEVQKGYFTYLDRKFPGMENVPANYEPVDQWYAFNRIMPDLHVIMALDAPKLRGNLYERPPFPVAWARMEGKGRVFYTTMGHSAAIWKDSTFLQMLLGGVRWATGLVEADIRPDLSKITPQAMEIPERASKYIASDPPKPNPQFPGFAVHFPNLRGAPANSAGGAERKLILFFSKSAGYEHAVVYREGASACFVELEMLKFGRENNIDLEFSKDGTIFTPENLARYDGFVFFTSGDLTNGTRLGPGDNYKMMPPEGRQLLLEAIRNGKGFVGIHSAIDAPATFGAYAKMLGAEFAGSGAERKERLAVVDRAFPGMSKVPEGYAASEEWYSFKNLQPDLRILLTHESGAPAAWARTEGKGRVYYTSLGHREEIWRDPTFRQMLLGAIRWTTGLSE